MNANQRCAKEIDINGKVSKPSVTRGGEAAERGATEFSRRETRPSDSAFEPAQILSRRDPIYRHMHG